MSKRDTTPILTTRGLLAELELLERYDRRRISAGHDYGSGQRASELRRRRRQLKQRLEEHRRHPGAEAAARDTGPHEVWAAFQRIGRPRLERAHADNLRWGTSQGGRRTVATWRQLERELERAAFGAELEQERETLEDPQR